MRVKKFEARSMKEALRMVKAELGPEAVILGARENKRSFGLGGETSFEVTAAVSDQTLQKKQFVESRLRPDDRERFLVAEARRQKQVIEAMVEKRRRQLEEEEERKARFAAGPRPITKVSYIDIPDDESTHSAYAPREQKWSSGQPAPSASRDRIQSLPQETLAVSPHMHPGVKIKSLARAAAEASRGFEPQPVHHKSTSGMGSGKSSSSSPVGATVAAQSSGHEVNELKAEIARLQNLIDSFQDKAPAPAPGATPSSMAPIATHPGAEFGLSYDFSDSYRRLVEAGVATDLAGEILLRASREIDPIQAKRKASIEAWVAKWLLTNVQICEATSAGRYHVFVGPVGGGKTAQLVKTAAQMVIKERKKIAIVSSDVSKVGAIDQLKIYAQILNVPFAVIRDKSDWTWIEQQLSHVDHILVDTSGASLREMEEIQRLRSLLPQGSQVNSASDLRVHLCLSATMKETDAMETLRRFRVANLTDLIFTGLDLCVQYGVIPTLQLKSGLPLHSFGVGSRIPEDFERATKERVLDLLYKLSSLNSSTAQPTTAARGGQIASDSSTWGGSL
jgi:flagellar biosynthesis protein FlhF